MSSPIPKKKNWGQILLLIVLGIWSIASIQRIIEFTLSPAGANDLYVYWFAGHFVREAQDPYDAFLKNEKPSLPIQYLDKTVTDLQDVVVPGWVPAPALTFPLIAILSSFAFLSWPIAKLVWLGFNLFFIVLIPPLILRIFTPGSRWERWITAAFLMIFLGLTATRYAASSGQTTFLVFVLSLGSIYLSKNRPIAAGILLGIALSKYSLSIGFFLYLLIFERNYKTTLTALAVQGLGIIGLSVMSGTAIADIIREYLSMLFLHSKMEGIHFASLFPSQPWDIQTTVVLTLAVAITLLLWYRRHREQMLDPQPSPIDRQHLLTILSFWALLVGYHRAYDAVLYALFISLGLQQIRLPETWKLTQRQQKLFLVFVTVSTMLLMLPAGSFIRGLLTEQIGRALILTSVRMTTLLSSAALVITLFLLFKIREALPLEEGHRG